MKLLIRLVRTTKNQLLSTALQLHHNERKHSNLKEIITQNEVNARTEITEQNIRASWFATSRAVVGVISAEDRATKGSGLKLLVNHIWNSFDTGTCSPTRVLSLRWTYIILVTMPISSGA